MKILKQKSYDVPIICIGNITVGGTGKTPHTEYLVNLLLKNNFRVAVLSRGYKRKTRGFVLSDHKSTPAEIGDEPYQIKSKFQDILVAVDKKRTRGIEKFLSLPKESAPDVILLDDAFQHRYVKPSYSVLLTDYNRLFTRDTLLPAGRLREPAYYAELANSIIVTKCPIDINPLEQRITQKEINAFPYQDLIYTSFSYGNLINVFNPQHTLKLEKDKDLGILAVSGIANPKTFHMYLETFCGEFAFLEFADHYQFKNKDIARIKQKFEELKNVNKFVVVTEKDASRMRFMKKIPDDFKQSIFYIPVEIFFINKDGQVLFDKNIVDHVRKNKRNS